MSAGAEHKLHMVKWLVYSAAQRLKPAEGPTERSKQSEVSVR